MLHLLDMLGITGNGRLYNFWSGFGANFGELAIVGAILRHINCNERGCYRLGHHVNGHIVCRKHRETAK